MNPQLGEYAFEVEGNTYTMVFDYESWVLIEEKLDKGIFKIMQEIESWSKSPENLRLGTVRTIFWAGLHRHQPKLTLAEATSLIFKMDGGIAGAVDAMSKTLERTFGASSSQATNPQQRAVNGSGTSSGSSTSATDTIQPASGPSLPASTSS
jgi:hypothetical protein